MLNVTGNNYRQSATGNADSVKLNACESNNSNASKLRCYAGHIVLIRKVRSRNVRKRIKIAGFVVAKSSYDAMTTKVMAGIVKIPCSKVFSFDTVATMLKLAHHFLSTLKNVVNAKNSGTELSTFNPFVVGSTPAGPTIVKVTAPCTKVWGVFFRPCSATETLYQHFKFHAVVGGC
jgi:hypothetical protein